MTSKNSYPCIALSPSNVSTLYDVHVDLLGLICNFGFTSIDQFSFLNLNSEKMSRTISPKQKLN